MLFEKNEVKYIVGATVFALVFFNWIIPKLISSGFENSNPLMQFLVINVGVVIFLQIYLKSRALSADITILDTVSLVFLIVGIDILIGPYMVSSAGELLSGPTFSSSGSDYIMGYIAINFLRLKGLLVYLFTYLVVPVILFGTSSLLSKNAIRKI